MRSKAFTVLYIALLIVGASGGVLQAEEVEPCPEDQVCVVYESFTWVGDEIVFYGDATNQVRITFDDTVLYADMVTMNEEEQWARLEGDVLVERDGTQIKALQANLALDDEVYIFEGDVYLKDSKASTPREIWADELEYDGDSGNIVAQGNVRMEEEKRWFTADRMDYDADNERMILEGNVMVNDERGLINAHRLDVDLQNETFSGTGPGRIVLSDIRRSPSNPTDEE